MEVFIRRDIKKQNTVYDKIFKPKCTLSKCDSKLKRDIRNLQLKIMQILCFSVAELRHCFVFICIVGGGIKVHSTLRPLNGLLCQPRVIMIMEKSVE
jgi:hypothetical protein